jgi:hypothetical protein
MVYDIGMDRRRNGRNTPQRSNKKLLQNKNNKKNRDK